APIRQVLSEYYDYIGELAARDEDIRGVPTGFIDLDNLLGGLQPSDLLIIAGRPGMGKCITCDTKIVNPETGQRIAIETLVRDEQASLLSLDSDYKLRPAKPTRFVDDGLKPAYLVRTALGREIKVTLSHPFLTLKGWRSLSTLTVGDYIATPRKITVFGDDGEQMYEAKILGYMLGDGSTRGQNPRFTNSNHRLRKDFSDAALHFPGTKASLKDTHGGRTPTIYVSGNLDFIKEERKHFANRLVVLRQKNLWTQVDLAKRVDVSASTIKNWENTLCVPTQHNFERLCDVLNINEEQLAPQGFSTISKNTPNSLSVWLQKQEVWGKAAADKDVPNCVYSYTKQKLALFLNRLFACDGSVYFQGDKQPVVSYSTVSEKLARSVQHLLLRYGVIARLRHRWMKYKDSKRLVYDLRITGVSNLSPFLNQISVFGKKEVIEKVIVYIQKTSSNTNLDVIPLDVWELIKQAKGDRTWRSIYDDIGLPPQANIHVGKRAPSRQRLLAIGQALNAQELINLAQSDIYWDKITTIKLIGKRQVYDLTVPDTHNFVADDMIVHNTGFALSIAKTAALTHKKHVAIFSLEMSNDQLVQRLLAQETGIDSQRLRAGKLEDSEWPKFTHAIEVLSDTTIFLDDTPSITPLQIRTKCRRLHLEYKLDLVIVDYLQLMSGDTRTNNRVQEVSYISRQMKILARELNVPVLAAAQLSRAVEKRVSKRPVLSDLRESGSLEQDADIVMFIYRPDMYEDEVDPSKKNTAEIIVAKHRNGPTGDIQLIFREKLAKFENAATQQVDLSQVT
ncbi:MAG: replicative DNA helicase, partial [Chloroflexota bacterium]|nr:replicative DNA helicase [Chloroflexota bacterium]